MRLVIINKHKKLFTISTPPSLILTALYFLKQLLRNNIFYTKIILLYIHLIKKDIR